MEPLLPAFRRELRTRAHHLHPVVSIGHHGLTPAVLHETDLALTAHELIKVRVFSDDRGERDTLLARICVELDCAAVQQIGKLLVLWRPRPSEAVVAPRAAPARVRKGTATGAGNEPAPASRRRRAGVGAAKPPTRPPASKDRRRNTAAQAPSPARPFGAQPRRPRGSERSSSAASTGPARRPAPPGKAPSGVPRAAAPRRRRRAG